MLLIPNSLEKKAPWIEAIAPKPQVFVNVNFYQKKILRLKTTTNQIIDINFEKNNTWPFKDGFFSTYYPVIRTLDRPSLVTSSQWNKVIEFFFCQKRGDVFKPEVLSHQYVSAEAYIYTARKRWFKVQEYKCKL